MKKSMYFLAVIIGLAAGVVYSDMDLKVGSLMSKSEDINTVPAAVGRIAKDETRTLCESGGGKDAIRAGMTGIINDGFDVATKLGDKALATETIRYTLVGVAMGGGKENLSVAKEAFDDSKAYSDEGYRNVAVVTFSAAAQLLGAESGGGGASGGASGGGEKTARGESGGGEKAVGGGGGGSPKNDEFGGGQPENMFDDAGSAVGSDDGFVEPFGGVRDRDSSATPV